MRAKLLEWTDHPTVSYSNDNIPQMAYFIRPGWDEVARTVIKRLEFIHGYVPAASHVPYTEYVGAFPDIDTAKVAAQTHFEKYIKRSFFEA